MTHTHFVPIVLLSAAATVVGLAAFADEPEPQQPQTKPTPANVDGQGLEHARTTVKMLDDVYKTAIVLITDKYVNTESDYPAGAAAVNWFEQINKKGWHTVRIIDATGDPYDPENVAKSDFEKQAIKKLKAGEAYAEQVTSKDGKSVLLAATAIPVVMEKCVMCHPHYENVKEGEAIGALTYEIPIR